MTHARTMVLAAALLAVAAAACGSGNRATPGAATPGGSVTPTQAGSGAASSVASAPATGAPPSATAAPPSAAAASVAPSSAPSGAATPGASVGLPSILDRHSAPDLEAQLPDVVAGATLSKYSLTLAEVLEDPSADKAGITAFVAGLGKTTSDAAVAAAYDATGKLGGVVQAYRIIGAHPAGLLAGIASIAQSDLGADAAIRQATIAGKGVTIVSVGTDVNDTQWLYSRGDIVYVVHAPDEATASVYLMALD